MKVVSIVDYKPWAGAQDLWNTALENGYVEELEETVIAMLDAEDDPPDTVVNDLLWFSPEQVVADMRERVSEDGLKDFDEVFESWLN